MPTAPEPQGGYPVKSRDQSSAERLEASTALAFPLVTPSAPVTTDVLVVNVLGQDEVLVITPAGTIAALTITFPADGVSRLGQKIRIVSHQIVTALTLSAGPTFRGTALTALAVDTLVSFQKIAANVWQRL